MNHSATNLSGTSVSNENLYFKFNFFFHRHFSFLLEGRYRHLLRFCISASLSFVQKTLVTFTISRMVFGRRGAVGPRPVPRVQQTHPPRAEHDPESRRAVWPRFCAAYQRRMYQTIPKAN